MVVPYDIFSCLGLSDRDGDDDCVGDVDGGDTCCLCPAFD